MQSISKLVGIFLDTKKKINSDPRLSEAVKNSINGTRLYMEDEYPEISAEKSDAPTTVTVSRDSTLQAVMRLKAEYTDSRIAALNFASAVNPGGGVVYGATAQEECICRCTTLYPVLKTDELAVKYYKFHKNRHSAIYTDACIWSPGIVILRSDGDGYKRIPEEKQCTADILTCAAPNLSPGSVGGIAASIKMTKEKLYDIHKKRARHILTIAAANGDDVLVLGAFGCGAFANDPEVVAAAYRDIIGEFSGYFRHIDFAVYSPGGESRNYKTFRTVMEKFFSENP